MNSKTLFWTIGFGAAAYGTWWMVKNLHVTPREKSIVNIVAKKYDGFETAFLKAWGDATKSGRTEFNYSGRVYITDGGRAKR